MKKLTLVLAGFIACAVLNAAPVVYVVNMGEVYRNYYKAKEAIAQINNAKEAATQELAKMDKSRQEIMKKIEEVQKKASNPALADDAKRKIAETEGQPLLIQLRQLEQNMQNISAQTSKRLQENLANVQKIHMQEISKIIENVAKEKKADFVIEKGVCHFAKPEADITQDVIKAVNAGAPAAK